MDWIDIRTSQPLQRQSCIFYAPNRGVSGQTFTGAWEKATVNSSAFVLSGYFPEGYMGASGVTHWCPLPTLPLR